MKKLLNTGLLIIGMLVLTVSAAHAQYALKLGDEQFNQFNYVKAIAYYQEAFQKKESVHAAERLADSYRLTKNYEQAELWYARVIGMTGSAPENVLKYAAVLRNNAKFAEAKDQYAKYATLKKVSDEQLQIWQASCDSAVVWMKNPNNNISIRNETKWNSDRSDWGAVAYNGGAVFSSDRNNENIKGAVTTKKKGLIRFDEVNGISKNTYGWTGNNYLRLYETNADSTTKLFPITPGTDYHIGSASFTEDGNEIFFTLTRIPKKGVKTTDKTIHIEIYSSKRDATGKWGAPQPFRYNKIEEYSVGDPYITPDGQTLYFVSNKPGGKGGTDLYYCQREADGKWGSAVNIDALNTAGNERTPVLDKENNFFFSSDGAVGIGGLDIYKSTKDGEAFSMARNMGSPLNTPHDDFAYIKTSPTTGYFTSDRPGGKGSDDIYSFVEILMIKLRLEGIVSDKNTQIPVDQALVSLSKAGGSDIKMTTDATGKYSFDLSENSDYSLKSQKNGYTQDSLSFTTVNIKVSQTIKKDLSMGRDNSPIAAANVVTTGDGERLPNKVMVPEMNTVGGLARFNNLTLNTPMRVGKIYYDFDKADIRPDAARELDKLVKIMNDYPNISIELGSYTDSRGVDIYNLDLSQRRANAAVAYIVAAGIDKARITAQGYGENGLVNKCANGVNCTPYQHQLNRRTEVKVVKK
ncbi:OmpA family protein [Mucilaginibacter myungsuensis]|uniref:OmpA family protein n=1 Tax=Mucilaginibacter myungsuensis TaxID=649104 RepID=A0A929L0J3_9SPHI|nr:OmpA family protein [Mucilaginibacter myungsuensis]MBE9664022.1 OmpA family protein [Mucilaginibacter myungsuensis]MDN3601201.1 OmpA family protein [Mucilaginibacter myungsuensis]